MTMGFSLAIADFDQKQFDALDTKTGAASSYSRLRQQEQDARWTGRYLGWHEGDVLKAAIPIYRYRMRSWPDPSYDPASWGMPGAVGDECSPGNSLMVGGCIDRRTGFHVDEEARTPGQLRRLLAEIAKVAADEDLCLVFPYMYLETKEALDDATSGRIVWAQLDREAHLFGLADPEWEAGLPARTRYRLRRDQRTIAKVPMRVAEASWDEVDSWASELIAQHSTAKGQELLPEFVSDRLSMWQSNPDVDLMVFTAEAAGLRGVQTVLLWGNELEVYEIGLSGEESEQRFAMYLNLLFHLPIQYARARGGIEHIRLGTKSETPKSRRGGVFQALHGGVLGFADTKRLARGEF
ncbi:hypothetical protein ACFU5O_32190 [Streptomyces sp. NPDC057445]|uniref:hypothetical protein n=1 Tax=Streptomyces sp. NPDC057445 TaxID=3346136 RepID=UPI0036C0BB16